MNEEKTGKLIADIRKEKNMTQKQLADKLHVSDRAVSKWERGSGFPDVTLLEPLSDALGILMTSLFKGERISASEGDMTVKDAVAFVYKQTKQKIKRKIGQIIASILLCMLIFSILFGMLDYSGAFLKEVYMEVPVGVYVDGIRVEDSTVIIDGERRTLGGKSFEGRFAIECIRETCAEDISAHIRWDYGGPGYEYIRYYRYASFVETDIDGWLYITENLGAFALKLNDGRIIATDEYFVPLMMLDRYYPLIY